MVWYSHLLKNFPQFVVIHTVKAFGITYIAISKIDTQWEFAVWLRKIKQGLCINLEGWNGGRRWEGSSKGRGYMYTYG